jgi:hypothetical protein
MHRILGWALMLASGVALGQGLNKWVDEKGRVHYGDQPPANAREQPITRGTLSNVGGPGGGSRPSQAASGAAYAPDASLKEFDLMEQKQKSAAARSDALERAIGSKRR